MSLSAFDPKIVLNTPASVISLSFKSYKYTYYSGKSQLRKNLANFALCHIVSTTCLAGNLKILLQQKKIMEEKDKKTQEPASGQKQNKKEKKDALKGLQAKISELENSLAKEKDDYIRLMAEFENYRRRSAAERLELIDTASEKIILEILPVLDDCERALKALGDSEDCASAKEGTELIYNKLLGILKNKGLKAIETEGKAFDTEFMEAVAQFPVQEEAQKGMVYDTVQKGYLLGEKVIRYAKVVVGQ